METAKDAHLKRREADGVSDGAEETARVAKKQRLEPTADASEIICSLFDAVFLLDASRVVTMHLASLLLKAELGETRVHEFAKDVSARLAKMEAALVEANPQTEEKGGEGAVSIDLGKLREYVKEARGLGVLVADQISAAEKKAGPEAMEGLATLRDDMAKFGSGERSKKSLEIAGFIKAPDSEDAPAGAMGVEVWLAELIICNLTSVQNLEDGISQVQSIAVSYYAPQKAAPANLLKAAAPAAAKAPSRAPAAVESVPPVNQKVYFVTNRKFEAKKGSYGGEDQDTADYGNTTVKIPQFVKGKMGKEGDHNYTVTANDIQRKSFDDFIKDVNSDLAPYPSKEILLFIHGYNVEYNEAMGALAGLVLDIKFQGPAIALDWASNGNVALYGFAPGEDDKDRVKSGAPLFSIVLKQLTNSIKGLNKVHILAHSMGNLMLDRILESLEKTSTPPASHPFRFVHTVILAAADISPLEGRNSLKRISAIPPPNKSGKRAIAIYCSTGDAALAASTAIQIGAGARVGYFMNQIIGKNHFFHPFYDESGLAETVEVKNTGLDAVGHSYYSYDREVLGDIKKLIEAEGKGNVRTKSSKCDGNPLCIPRLWSLPKVRKS
eukprot:TRINITY_DN499_c1_g5_i1.p1 TRINITY_DN499_c1_g5~~TRINITY_DN499_c1_g5_i1.p1  ORF type:complete len:610 (-),score=108.12 TRINITY_DN499_c1_g5_i1:267-2096(-)